MCLPSHIPNYRPVISNGRVTAKVSLHINAVKISFYTTMVCCQPSMTAKMNNMACNSAQSGHDLLCKCAPRTECFHYMYRGTAVRILKPGSLQTF